MPIQLKKCLLKRANKLVTPFIAATSLILFVGCAPDKQTQDQNSDKQTLTVHANQTLVNTDKALNDKAIKTSDAHEADLIKDATTQAQLIEKKLVENAVLQARKEEQLLIEVAKQHEQLMERELKK